MLSAYDGGEGSIISDLTKHKTKMPNNIITVESSVPGADDSAITDAEAAYKAMNAASTPADKYAADQQLHSAITYLVSALNAAGMNDKDKTLVTRQQADNRIRAT